MASTSQSEYRSGHLFDLNLNRSKFNHIVDNSTFFSDKVHLTAIYI